MIAILGDSVSGAYTDGDGKLVWDANWSYPTIVARRLGFGISVNASGPLLINTIAEITKRTVTLPNAADLVIINVGVNDLLESYTDSSIMNEHFDALLAAARLAMPRALVVIVGIRDISLMRYFPQGLVCQRVVRGFNAYILSRPGTVPVPTANRPGAYDALLFPDGTHPSRLGVTWLADAVCGALMAWEAAREVGT